MGKLPLLPAAPEQPSEHDFKQEPADDVHRSASYKPSFPALFSRNSEPSQMYRRTIWTDVCPV
jgi:hypothetical protein